MKTHPSTIKSIIDPPKLFHRLLHHPVHLFLFRYIHLHYQRLVMRVRCYFHALERCGLGGGFVHVGEDNAGGAFGCVGERTAFAQAGTWRGQGGLAVGGMGKGVKGIVPAPVTRA